MAAGYRSIAARHLGGASSSEELTTGYRSICAIWLGGAGAYPGPANAGYRSLLAYWLGGASSSMAPEEPIGGGRGRQYIEEYYYDEEGDLMTLIPCMLTVIESEC